MGSKSNSREPNDARNARIAASRKGTADIAMLRQSAVMARNARKKSPLFGGPEGSVLGGAASTLGVL
jgi:hypothetical protein